MRSSPRAAAQTITPSYAGCPSFHWWCLRAHEYARRHAGMRPVRNGCELRFMRKAGVWRGPRSHVAHFAMPQRQWPHHGKAHRCLTNAEWVT
ncbi:MAG: hypothetical protein OJF61_000940 [Rhodanobacteraceae bacterium]|nr:MAG: hypothetical protein OJF61_000940 [Rhodanobacteraceae bacterium]